MNLVKAFLFQTHCDVNFLVSRLYTNVKTRKLQLLYKSHVLFKIVKLL